MAECSNISASGSPVHLSVAKQSGSGMSGAGHETISAEEEVEVMRKQMLLMAQTERERAHEMICLQAELERTAEQVARLTERVRAMQRTQVEVVSLWEKNHVGAETGILKILRSCWKQQDDAATAEASGIAAVAETATHPPAAKAKEKALAPASGARQPSSPLSSPHPPDKAVSPRTWFGMKSSRSPGRAAPSAAAEHGRRHTTPASISGSPRAAAKVSVKTTRSEVKRKVNLGIFQFEKVRESVLQTDSEDDFSDSMDDVDEDEDECENDSGDEDGGGSVFAEGTDNKLDDNVDEDLCHDVGSGPGQDSSGRKHAKVESRQETHAFGSGNDRLADACMRDITLAHGETLKGGSSPPDSSDSRVTVAVAVGGCEKREKV